MAILSAFRNVPPGELQQSTISGNNTLVAISEFGDGTWFPQPGQRTGYITPWPVTLGEWYMWSTGPTGTVVPVTVVIAGYRQAWNDVAPLLMTANAGPSLTTAAQGSGSSVLSGWAANSLQALDRWEWEILTYSGAGSKLYLAQLLTRDTSSDFITD